MANPQDDVGHKSLGGQHNTDPSSTAGGQVHGLGEAGQESTVQPQEAGLISDALGKGLGGIIDALRRPHQQPAPAAPAPSAAPAAPAAPPAAAGTDALTQLDQSHNALEQAQREAEQRAAQAGSDALTQLDQSHNALEQAQREAEQRAASDAAAHAAAQAERHRRAEAHRQLMAEQDAQRAADQAEADAQRQAREQAHAARGESEFLSPGGQPAADGTDSSSGT